jgi:hypothetical protein
VEAISNPVTRRILEVTGWSSQNQIGRELGIDSTHWSKREGAGKPIPISVLERIAWRTGCRVEYLQTGEGPIYARGELVRALSPTLQQVIVLMRQHEALQPILLRCAEILASAHPDAIRTLDHVTYGLQLALAEAEAIREDCPDHD